MSFIIYVTSCRVRCLIALTDFQKYKLSYFMKVWNADYLKLIKADCLKFMKSDSLKLWIAIFLIDRLSKILICWIAEILNFILSDYCKIWNYDFQCLCNIDYLNLWVSALREKNIDGEWEGRQRVVPSGRKIALKSAERQRKPLQSRRKWLTLREINNKTMLIIILYFLLLCAIIKGFGTVIALVVRLAMLLMMAIGRIISLLISRKSFVRA